HLVGLKRSLIRGEFRPGQRSIYFTRSELCQVVGKVIRRADVALRLRRRSVKQSDSLLLREPGGSDDFPTLTIPLSIPRDCLGGRLQREVRRGERYIAKERSLGELRGMLLETL